MTTSITRRSAVALAAALFMAAPLAACSDDDGDTTETDSGSPSATASDTGSDDMDDMTDDTAMEDMEDMSDDTMADDEAASGEVETTGLLDYLNEEDPEIGALFDWNTGDGVIAISYLGTQAVGLYGAGEVDEATAMTACEMASTYVFDIDPEASITVYTGGYSDGVPVVEREGEAGSCGPATPA